MSNGVYPQAEWIPGLIEGKCWNDGMGARVGFCDHTAGGYMTTMRNASFWNGAQVSAHFCIGLDGSVIQLVNIFDTAWAQGRLGPRVSWPPYDTMKGETATGNPNAWLISTEHEDRASAPVWTPAMYEADLRVKRWCVEEVRRVLGVDPLRFGLDSLAGHHMFDSVNRSNCPGPHWRDEYRNRLYADLKEEDNMNEEERRLYAALAKTVLTDYRIKSHGVHPGHGKEVVEVTNPDGSSADPPIILAIRS